MAWGTKTQINTNTVVNSTTRQGQSTAKTSTPEERFHVQVSAQFGAAATSNLIVHLMSTLETGDTNYDTIDRLTFLIPAQSTSTRLVSFLVSDVHRWRLEYNLDTGTQNVTVNAWYAETNLDL